MTPTSKRTHAHFNIYIKQTNCETFIYIRKARQFSRNKTVFITVLFTKIQTHHATRFFMKTLKLACICKEKEWKYMLHDVYIDINPDTSRKARQFAIRFLYTKSLTLCVQRSFMEILILAEERGHFYKQKKCT